MPKAPLAESELDQLENMTDEDLAAFAADEDPNIVTDDLDEVSVVTETAEEE